MSTVAGTAAVSVLSDSAVIVFPLLLLAAAVWRLDRQHRNGGALEPLVPGAGRLLQQLSPELLGLLVVGVVVSIAVVAGGNAGQGPTSDDQEAVWGHIRNEWQLLMTADTLLAMQAILRLLLLCSAAARRAEYEASALSGEPTALFLFAGAARCVLLVLSPRDVYHLDGPLGGYVYAAVEVATFALLLVLARSMLCVGTTRMTSVLVLAIVAGLLSESNHYAVADPADAYLDQLFSFAQVVDAMAAGCFFVRTLLLSSAYTKDPFATFAHLLLPVQQFLAMYFLLTWVASPFEVVPALVGAGYPFEVLQMSSIAAVGVYIFAASMHLALLHEDKGEDIDYAAEQQTLSV
mmetsp:Transcript_13125/g.29871  ORF Transcript_13125/g.29871 Transcript_13125/m.29871 type:complete len:349 (-) Transcript_13125:48-1094(-)